MAAITPSSIYVESIGSLRILIASITITTNSDTWTIDKGDPVVAFWGQSVAGAGLNEPDVTWAPSTGIFTFTSGTTVSNAITLFVLQRS